MSILNSKRTLFTKQSSAIIWVGILSVLTSFAAIGTAFIAMITHIVICIKSGSWILLIIGVIAPPVGIVHGIGHWFGVW